MLAAALLDLYGMDVLLLWYFHEGLSVFPSDPISEVMKTIRGTEPCCVCHLHNAKHIDVKERSHLGPEARQIFHGMPSNASIVDEHVKFSMFGVDLGHTGCDGIV
ncbi:hypothetical protein MKX08_001052 [Trichoderma sp. CBMAI-0020]|nr:hypothetical protein MKX08_001052 [Trichoderma sp. CBMAI-0020]